MITFQFSSAISQPLPDTDVLRHWPDKREAAKRLKMGLSSPYRKIEELELDL